MSAPNLPPLPGRPWHMYCTKCGKESVLEAINVKHPVHHPDLSFGVCSCGYFASAGQEPFTADQMHTYGLACYQQGLDDAAKVCQAAEKEMWDVYKGRSDNDSARRGTGSEYIQGASDQSGLLCDAIRQLKDTP